MIPYACSFAKIVHVKSNLIHQIKQYCSTTDCKDQLNRGRMLIVTESVSFDARTNPETDNLLLNLEITL